LDVVCALLIGEDEIHASVIAKLLIRNRTCMIKVLDRCAGKDVMYKVGKRRNVYRLTERGLALVRIYSTQYAVCLENIKKVCAEGE